MFLQQNTLDGVRKYFTDSLIHQFSESEIKLMFKTFVMKRLNISETEFMIARGRLSASHRASRNAVEGANRGLSRAETRFSESDLLYFRSVVKRLQTNEPFQYIVGTTEFYGLELICDKRALIPRPETEELVDWIVESSDPNEHFNMIDVCAGSGCIALALKSVFKNSEIEAWELSQEAVELIIENREFTQLEIRIMKVDALSDGYPAADEYYDVIVSNPPYIPQADRFRMEANVLDFEPEMALFVEDDDPFIFYNKIATESINLLVDNGWLYFEIHEDYADEMIACLENHGFVNIELRKDLQGRARMIRGQRVPSQHE